MNKVFPSPHGDCISQIILYVQILEFLLIVSVPSRGLHFSNKMEVNFFKVFYCFRPLTGTAFLKYWMLYSDTDREGNEFPSPHGDCISQIGIHDNVHGRCG